MIHRRQTMRVAALAMWLAGCAPDEEGCNLSACGHLIYFRLSRPLSTYSYRVVTRFSDGTSETLAGICPGSGEVYCDETLLTTLVLIPEGFDLDLELVGT